MISSKIVALSAYLMLLINCPLNLMTASTDPTVGWKITSEKMLKKESRQNTALTYFPINRYTIFGIIFTVNFCCLPPIQIFDATGVFSINVKFSDDFYNLIVLYFPKSFFIVNEKEKTSFWTFLQFCTRTWMRNSASLVHMSSYNPNWATIYIYYTNFIRLSLAVFFRCDK